MAINRIWQTGFEAGSTDELDTVVSAVVTTGQKNTGAYSFYCGGANNRGIKSIPATRQIRMGFFEYGKSALDTIIAFELQDVSENQLVGLTFGSSGAVKLQVEDVQQDIAPGLVETEWHHFGLDVKIDASSGWVKVYYGGVEVLSYTGDTGNVDLELIRFGAVGASGPTVYFDDVYVDDTTGEGAAAVCPVLRFPYLTPTGAGNYTQWDPSAGNNYECVDEVPPSDADYVDTAVTDELDSYAMSTYTLDVGESFKAMIPVARAQRGETTEQLALGTRYSGTDVLGSDQDPSVGSYDYLYERQVAKPGGGDWDQTSVDGVEFVQKSRGTY